MLAKIKAFFDSELVEESGRISEEKKRLACAALLIEVAVIDQEFDDSEFKALQTILSKKFGISQDECQALTSLAQSESSDSTSMYQFTRLVNDSCSIEDKFDLVKGMWIIAYADGELDKYEEYIIRKVSDLIHVSHGDFIRAKHAARQLHTEN